MYVNATSFGCRLARSRTTAETEKSLIEIPLPFCSMHDTAVARANPNRTPYERNDSIDVKITNASILDHICAVLGAKGGRSAEFPGIQSRFTNPRLDCTFNTSVKFGRQR